MRPILIKDATIVNENSRKVCDVLIRDNRIEKIDEGISVDYKCDIINAEKLILIPGLIDDQVHFREPGLTHKGNIYTESMAAVAGGVTSFMEMPNTIPNAITNEELEKKYVIGQNTSFGNYSFCEGIINKISDIEKVELTDLEIGKIIEFLNSLTDRNGNNRPIGRPENVPSGLTVD